VKSEINKRLPKFKHRKSERFFTLVVQDQLKESKRVKYPMKYLKTTVVVFTKFLLRIYKNGVFCFLRRFTLQNGPACRKRLIGNMVKYTKVLFH
jgi:hypothetical protein